MLVRNSSREHREIEPGRRDFVTKLLGAWSLLIVAPIAKVILEYVAPRTTSETRREVIRVASTNDLAPNTARIFKVSKDPVIVVHTATGQYKAFNARCTHLGCVVQFTTDEGPPHFSCNCHGSEFDINGKNIVGPASRPLVPYKVIVRESSILVAKV